MWAEAVKPRQVRDRGLPLTCCTCGQVFHPATEGALTKHVKETGHSRMEWRP